MKWSASRLNAGDDGLTVVGQLGQSLDGQIATATGHSKYINGQGGLTHLHALRAWADVVVIGVGTLVADNPKLTVRMVPGHSPDRVVIDPSARSPADAACLVDQSVRRVVLTGTARTRTDWPFGVEQVNVQISGEYMKIDVTQFRQWIAAQGWHRVLIEGGAATLAGFLNAGSLDYLHLIMSPLMIGPGVAGIRANQALGLSQVARFKAHSFGLGQDLLIECVFH